MTKPEHRNGHGPLRPCVVYAAKSTDDESGSIESQTAEVMAAIEHKGGRYVHGCPQSDERFSGYTGSRGPGLAEAIRLAEEAAKEHGEAELWGFDPDRFARGDGRRARHLGGLLFALWEKGVELRCIEGDDDLRDPIRAVLRGERNRQDSEAKSGHTRRGKRARWEDGKVLGGPVHDGYRLVPDRLPNGEVNVARDGRVVFRRRPDPARKPLILRAFSLVESGMTFGDVARLYNREGHKTRRGNSWSTRTIRELVKNPYYAGWVPGYGERRKGEHEPLIDPERWEAIQVSLERLDPAAVQRRKGGRRSAEDYALRGIAFCSRCGSSMYTRRFASTGRTYVCRNVREATGLCHAPKLPAAPLENSILGHLDDLLPGLDGWLAEMAAGRTNERTTLERALREESRRLAALDREVDLLRDDYRRHLRGSEQRRADLVLAELERVTDLRNAQARSVEEAKARLGEWGLEPTATDAALDFYSQCRDLIRGRIREARGVAELNAALSDLLAGVWVGVRRNGWLGADFVLRAPDEEPLLFTIRPDWTEPAVPAWLRAKLDASPWCTSSR